MSARNPLHKQKSRLTAKQKQNLAVIKTSIPLVITVLLLGLVYVFVLRPEEPARVVKRAIINSSDSSKYTSYRYSGTFGDDNRDVKGDYSGQVASSGNRELRIRLKNDKESTSLELKNVEGATYARLTDVSSLPSLLDSVAGAPRPSSALLTLLGEVQDSWVRIDESSIASMKCTAELQTSLERTGGVITDANYPYEYVSGPTLPGDDTEDEIYQLKLKSATLTLPSGPELFLACLDREYGVQDDRLRSSGSADIASTRVTVRVDPLSDTVLQITYKQVGMYQSLSFSDYNKDVTVLPPDSFVTIADLLPRLSEGSRDYLAQQLIGQ